MHLQYLCLLALEHVLHKLEFRVAVGVVGSDTCWVCGADPGLVLLRSQNSNRIVLVVVTGVRLGCIEKFILHTSR